MSSKEGLCIICGHYVPDNERLMATYHTTCFAGTDADMVKDVIDAHIPSLTDEDEGLIYERTGRWGEDVTAADYALRTCHCGQRIDGFYEYVDHLKDRLRNAGVM